MLNGLFPKVFVHGSVCYYSTMPSTELSLDFLRIPLETGVIIPAFPLSGTQVVSEGFYHLQVMVSNSVYTFGFLKMGCGNWAWLHQPWASHLAEIT